MPEKGEKVRRALIDSARTSFYRKGYAATSVGDVAAAASLEKGHLTYYFESKSALLKEVAGAWDCELRTQVAKWDALGLRAEKAVMAFVSMVEARADSLANFGCPIGTLSGELGKNSPELQAEARRSFDVVLNWLIARFAEEVPASAARTKAELLFAMAEGVAVLGHAYRDPALIRRQARQMRRWVALEFRSQDFRDR